MSGPIRCAHVVATTGNTGAERYVEVLLRALDPRRVVPTLIVPGPGPLVDRMRAAGVAVEEGAPERKLAFGAAARLGRSFANRFDIVHAHGPRATFWSGRAARQAGIRFATTVHELRWTTLPAGPRRALWTWLEDSAVARADHIIAVSEVVRDALVARHPDWAERVSVVYGSSPLLAEPAAPRVASLDPATLRIVYVGRFDWVKGADVLIDALAELHGRGIRFDAVLAGSAPPADTLRSRADRLGLGPVLRWDCPAADVPGVLANADVFVTATRFETFGIAVLEAMASGIAVVAPRVGGLAELLTPETGALVEPEPRRGLASRIADAIEALARDPDRRERIGRAAARRARERFGPPALADGMSRIYERPRASG